MFLPSFLLSSKVLSFSLFLFFTFLCSNSAACCIFVRSHTERVQPPCPSLPLPPRETSDRQSRCVAWSSPAWGPWGRRRGTAPRQSLAPRPWASSALGSLSSPRCEPWPSMCGWGSPGVGLWHKISSGASLEPPGSPSGGPAEREKKWQRYLMKIIHLF